MKKDEIIQKYWHEYLLWCANMPANSSSTTLFTWLNLNEPNEKNFWEWFVSIKEAKIDE